MPEQANSSPIYKQPTAIILALLFCAFVYFQWPTRGDQPIQYKSNYQSIGDSQLEVNMFNRTKLETAIDGDQEINTFFSTYKRTSFTVQFQNTDNALTPQQLRELAEQSFEANLESFDVVQLGVTALQNGIGYTLSDESGLTLQSFILANANPQQPGWLMLSSVYDAANPQKEALAVNFFQSLRRIQP